MIILNNLKIKCSQNKWEIRDLGFFFVIALALGLIISFPTAALFMKASFYVMGLVGLIIFLICHKLNSDQHHKTTLSPSCYFFYPTFFGILTYFGFYELLLEHYWVGLDEPVLLGVQSFWFAPYDNCCARPLAGLEAFIGNLITPGKISGLLIVNALCRWIIATSIFFLVTLLWPKSIFLALVAGILMVINPTEVLRFAPGLITPYVGVTTFLMLAVVSYVYSYIAQSKFILLFALSFLGIAFLHYETIFPVAIALPFLIYFTPFKFSRLLWVGAWQLITLVFAVRFVLFFFKGTTYQGHYIPANFSILQLVENFIILLKPLFMLTIADNLSILDLFQPLPLMLGASTLVFLMIFGRHLPRQSYPPLIFWFFCLILALLPEILVVGAQSHVPDFQNELTMRLEFTPGPWQVLLLSFLFGLILSFLPYGKLWFSLLASIIVILSLAGSIKFQAEKGRLNSYLNFSLESKLFRDAEPIIRKLPIDTTIFFIIPDDQPSPFGWGYHVFHMSCLLFGLPAYAGHYSAALGIQHRQFPYPTPVDSKNHYLPLLNVRNMRFIRIEYSAKDNAFRVSEDSQISNKADLPISVGPLGPCSVPKAKLLPNGQLPFILHNY